MFTENLDNKTREKKAAAAAAEVKFALCAFKMMFKHLFNAMFSI